MTIVEAQHFSQAPKIPCWRQRASSSLATRTIKVLSVYTGDTVVEIKGIPSEKDTYIKESFEAAGYKFIELFEDSIMKLKEELIESGVPINSLIQQIIEGHNSKCYFVYDISKSS